MVCAYLLLAVIFGHDCICFRFFFGRFVFEQSFRREVDRAEDNGPKDERRTSSFCLAVMKRPLMATLLIRTVQGITGYGYCQ